jgi:excinuclease ABC subunit C
LRNKITRLRSLQQKQFVSSVGEHDVDVVAVVIEQGLVAVNLVMVRAGQHVGDKTFFPTHTKSMLKEVGDDKLAAEAAEAEVLMGFCAHHYLSQSVPPLILLNHRFEWEALEEVLTAQRGGKVVLQAHSTQEKKVWQQMALHNAHLAITQKLAQEATQEHRLQALIEALELPVETARLECFDISHTQGEATVASCVVFDNNALQSSQYRRFNVQPAVGGDDYAAMREALSRRCARIAAEEIPRPDVIIIDGGKGQVGVAAQVLEEHGLSDIIMFGSAKGVERKKGQEQIIFPGRELPLRLGENHPGLHLIQTLQDEAHRFAIQSHRARRAKVRTQSALQEIDGVGPKRRQDLLKHFGGIVGVEKAGVDDLMRVKGISKELALRIYSAMH